MNKSIPLVIFLSILLLSTNSVVGQLTDSPVSFDLSQDHELTAEVRGALTWDDGEQEQLRVNLSMTDYRVNESEIQIIRIVYAYVESGTSSPRSAETSNTSQVTLTTTNPSVVYNPILSVPEAFDRFYINITFIASAEGGGVDETPDFYSLRFPQDRTIIVQRDNIVPVVNLYGFPQISFFSFWTPIYGIFIFSLLSPAIIVGFIKIQEMRKEDVGSTSEDVGTETSGDAHSPERKKQSSDSDKTTEEDNLDE